MAERNVVKTVKLQLSIDEVSDRLLQRMSNVGLFGKNRVEVASWVIRQWIWHNQADLERLGIVVKSEMPSRQKPLS